MINTEPFTTSSGDYLSTLMGIWIPRYGWTVILPLLVCVGIGIIVDVRFLFIALMLLFIMIPMLMSFLYTYYMLTPEARRAVIRKRVEIDDGHFLRLIYLPPEKPVLKSPVLGVDQKPEEMIVDVIVPEPEEIPWEKIRKIKYSSRFTIYILETSRLQFILVPYLAVPRK